MIYLTTGANGTGKTAFGLQEVRAKQLKENRPVYWNGRFRLTADFGWIKIDAKDWQQAPDGAIFFFDECHNDFPPGTAGREPPEVKMLAEHRVRGFDFFLYTQHPKNINAFIRRIIASPGWHRHLKRNFGTSLVSHIDYVAVCDNPEKPGAGNAGTVSMKALPKEVYSWYQSAELHTGKVKIPKQLWVLLACVLAVPVLIFFFVKVFYGNIAKQAGSEASKPPLAAVTPGRQASGPSIDEKRPLTPAEYAQSFQPRVPGLQYSASRYDGLTQPKQAPKPAACLDGVRPGAKVRTCSCYTQQATPLDVPEPLCRQIAAHGIFDDTLEPSSPSMGSKPLSLPPAAPVQVPGGPPEVVAAPVRVGLVLEAPDTRSTVQRDGEILQQMRKRSYIQ